MEDYALGFGGMNWCCFREVRMIWCHFREGIMLYYFERGDNLALY